MTDHQDVPEPANPDSRLREILSSWHRRRGYRAQASTYYRSRSVRPASQTDLNREFKSPRHIEWQWFLVALLTFTVIVFFYLRRWG
jgi:hypothetical protein